MDVIPVPRRTSCRDLQFLKAFFPIDFIYLSEMETFFTFVPAKAEFPMAFTLNFLESSVIVSGTFTVVAVPIYFRSVILPSLSTL